MFLVSYYYFGNGWD